MTSSIYNLSALDSKGNEVQLSQYEGKVILIVNTASKCGLTPQFEGLEALYQKYKEHGLVILGFPCAQFANQEFNDQKKTEEFCQLNYGVTFPIMKQIEVNGNGTHPIFAYLKSQTKHWLLGSRIKWNFTKFLISKDGKKIERFAPITKPERMEQAIKVALGL